MTGQKPVDARSLVADAWRSVFQTIWDKAANASNAVSETLIESSSQPLYVKRQAGTHAPADPLPLLALDRFLAHSAPPSDNAKPIPAVYIVREVNSYLEKVPGGGALLRNVVAHIAERTSYSKGFVRRVILQNFRSNGELIWK